MAVVLFRPELDVWEPGEHNGTFRGFNHAFVTATRTLDFWTNDDFARSVRDHSAAAIERMRSIAIKAKDIGATVRGRGLMLGIAFDEPTLAGDIAAECFQRGLIVETAGVNDEVLKFLPPLTITREELMQGFDIVTAAADVVLEKYRAASAA